MPALHRAPGARTVIVLTLPLVIATGVLVQHPWTDRILPGTHDARTQQIVADRGEPEAGARAFVALIEDGHSPLGDFLVRLQVSLDRNFYRYLDQRGHEHLVAEIHRVGSCVEIALGLLRARLGLCFRHVMLPGVTTARVLLGEDCALLYI